MKGTLKILIILLLAWITLGSSEADQTVLFPIVYQNEIGFMYADGRVAIKPSFLAAGEFSEGLCPARKRGDYGYINMRGEWAIPPQFDFAESFQEGFAIVYKDGKPFYINKQGKVPFEHPFAQLTPFNHGRAGVKTHSHKAGMINLAGQLLIDTVYARIKWVDREQAIVYGFDFKLLEATSNEVGVIDTNGRFIVPFGLYSAIDEIETGGYIARTFPEPWDTLGDESSVRIAILDRSGKSYLWPNSAKYTVSTYSTVSNGLTRVELPEYWNPKGPDDYYQETYPGYVNMNGEVVINDTSFNEVYPFSCNRAFVETKSSGYFIIDTKGKRLSDKMYSKINEQGFVNGIAIVMQDGLYGLIDTNERFIVEPRFRDIEWVGLVGDFFFFLEEKKDDASEYPVELKGIANIKGEVILGAIMDDVDLGGFSNGLLKCVIDDRFSYVNEQGKIVWQEKPATNKKLQKLNLDYMNRGYFYAYSAPHNQDLGGFGGSINAHKPIKNSHDFAVGQLSLVVKPEDKGKMPGNYIGMGVYLANTSNDTVLFGAQDSRLKMKVQAKNKNGEWQDIEYLPSSWCGNSYHWLSLPPQQYWSFLTPVYEGSFKTKLRIAAKYMDKSDPKTTSLWSMEEIDLYSNEYEGYINPGQFWRKPEYYPSGLMDPYID